MNVSRLSNKYRFSCSNTLWLGTRNRFNDQLNSSSARFTYFVPSDAGWRSLENEMPSAYKKLFMPEFTYHVSIWLHWFDDLRMKIDSDFYPHTRPAAFRLTQFWSVTWLSAIEFSRWMICATCLLETSSSSTRFVISSKFALPSTRNVSHYSIFGNLVNNFHFHLSAPTFFSVVFLHITYWFSKTFFFCSFRSTKCTKNSTYRWSCFLSLLSNLINILASHKHIHMPQKIHYRLNSLTKSRRWFGINLTSTQCKMR